MTVSLVSLIHAPDLAFVYASLIPSAAKWRGEYGLADTYGHALWGWRYVNACPDDGWPDDSRNGTATEMGTRN
jgi:hypothetical protein